MYIRKKKEFLLFLLFFFVFMGVFQQIIYAEQLPLEVVKKTVDEILDVLKNQELTKPENHDKRQKLIKEAVVKLSNDLAIFALIK